MKEEKSVPIHLFSYYEESFFSESDGCIGALFEGKELVSASGIKQNYIIFYYVSIAIKNNNISRSSTRSPSLFYPVQDSRSWHEPSPSSLFFNETYPIKYMLFIRELHIGTISAVDVAREDDAAKDKNEHSKSYETNFECEFLFCC